MDKKTERAWGLLGIFCFAFYDFFSFMFYRYFYLQLFHFPWCEFFSFVWVDFHFIFLFAQIALLEGTV